MIGGRRTEEEGGKKIGEDGGRKGSSDEDEARRNIS